MCNVIIFYDYSSGFSKKEITQKFLQHSLAISQPIIILKTQNSFFAGFLTILSENLQNKKFWL